MRRAGRASPPRLSVTHARKIQPQDSTGIQEDARSPETNDNWCLQRSCAEHCHLVTESSGRKRSHGKERGKGFLKIRGKAQRVVCQTRMQRTGRPRVRGPGSGAPKPERTPGSSSCPSREVVTSLGLFKPQSLLLRNAVVHLSPFAPTCGPGSGALRGSRPGQH